MSNRRSGSKSKKYDKGAARSAPAGAGQMIVASAGGGFVRVGVAGSDALLDPHRALGLKISEALDPTKAPSKPKTFAEMTDEEKAEMRRLYERKRGGTTP